MNKGLLILVIGAILLFCAVYFLNPAYSITNKNECGILTPPYQCIDKIIKQNDWANCVLKHKEAHSYDPPNDDSTPFHAQNYDDLVTHCGEMP